MTHNATFCPECGREMTRVKMNRLIGRDGWRWYCPVCAPGPHAHTPIVPWCVQCGQPMRPDGQQHGWAHGSRTPSGRIPWRPGGGGSGIAGVARPVVDDHTNRCQPVRPAPQRHFFNPIPLAWHRTRSASAHASNLIPSPRTGGSQATDHRDRIQPDDHQPRVTAHQTFTPSGGAVNVGRVVPGPIIVHRSR